ncbi:MAG TPA: hypothetical protein VFA47_09475, partial [Candidatus Manganitrophaceae bacterium]|nr:hypothetical protein [Candidatus Manganitrophaceae bacterium]
MTKKKLPLFFTSVVIAGLLLSPVLVRAQEEEGDDKPMKPVPKAYAEKHMPKGWWTDPKIIAEGKK